MDYSRIYRDFIADRLEKQPEKPSYFERHHILPRGLGGGDQKSNIIRLTPEDHFFAHLLLAKIHGGDMWAPVAFMVGGSRKDYKPTVSRARHGWAARAMAKARSGEAAHQFDRQTHFLVHGDGRKWSGLQSEMTTALGLTRSFANMLIAGRVNTAKGWRLLGSPARSRSGKDHHMYRAEVFEFVHVDGRAFVGTQFEFCEKFNMRRPDANRLVNGVYKISHGWRLQGVTPSHLGRGAKWLTAAG